MILILLLLIDLSYCVVREEWIDPHRMEKPRKHTYQMQTEQCPTSDICCVHLRQFVSHLKSELKSVNLEQTLVQTKRYSASLVLTKDDAFLLDRFIKTKDDIKSDLLIDSMHALTRILHNFKEVEDEFSDQSFDLTNWLQLIWTPARIFIDICAIIIVAQSVRKISWSYLLLSIVMISFLMSVVWNWFRMYQEERAKIVARMRENDAFKACHAPPMTPVGMITTWFASMFVLPSTKSKCEQYYLDLMAEPWTNVSPFKAVVVTFTEGVATPMTIFFNHLGEGMNRYLQHFPVVYQPIAIFLLIIMVIMILFFNSRYGINLFCGLVQITPMRNESQQTPSIIDAQSQRVENDCRSPCGNDRHPCLAIERHNSCSPTSCVRRRSVSLSRVTKH